jgi:hypothetical protein
MVNQLFFTDTTNSAVDIAFLKINQQRNNRRHFAGNLYSLHKMCSGIWVDGDGIEHCV